MTTTKGETTRATKPREWPRRLAIGGASRLFLVTPRLTSSAVELQLKKD